MNLECLFFGHDYHHYIDVGRPTDEQLKALNGFAVPYYSKPVAVCSRCGDQDEYEYDRHGRLPELMPARDEYQPTAPAGR